MYINLIFSVSNFELYELFIQIEVSYTESNLCEYNREMED